MPQTLDALALALHKENRGKIRTSPVSPVATRHDLSLTYTPGVAAPSREIAKDKSLSFDLTWRGRTVAVISDGSAVLGLGNVGPEAALPVMEGKSLLLQQFAGIDSIPLVINTQETEEIIRFIRQVAPSFAGINIEDISAPRCFKIEEELQDLGIPVFHDDQHGTAIVASAALKNAAKVVGKSYDSLKVVVIGAGAAGLAISKMLMSLNCRGERCQKLAGEPRVKDLILVDSKGSVYRGREGLNSYKEAVGKQTNGELIKGGVAEAVKGADVIIGVSKPGLITKEMISTMADKPIIFALANPTPEIMPEEAKEAGAAVVASGRSDFPNQINNVLAFPGVFKAVVNGKLVRITPAMKNAAATAVANMIPKPSAENIIPDVFAPNLAGKVAQAILKAAGPADIRQ